MLEIHWDILLVQIATFLVAVAILWRLFWKPLVNMMEKRRKTIETNLAEAKHKEEEAAKLFYAYDQKLSQIAEEAKVIISKAFKDAQQNKNQIIKEAQDEAKYMLENAKSEIEIEKNAAIEQVRKEAISLSIQIAEKILKQSVDRKIQKRMLDEFVKEAV